MLKPADDNSHPLADCFRAFIREPDFPCVGAKSALGRGQLRVVVARDIRSGWDDLRILPTLMKLADEYRADPVPFQSLAVVFEKADDIDEPQFEVLMWQRLQSLSDKDGWLGQPTDARVSDDPDNPHFSLSFGGEAFFVVGLHPAASRAARRFKRPALIFNLHDQFEQLRDQGRYEPLRKAIIERDIKLDGEANPMLAQHGELSNARQYSGRAVGNEWQCPFAPPARRLDQDVLNVS